MSELEGIRCCPTTMTVDRSAEAGGPEVLVPATQAGARAGPGRGADRGRGRRHQSSRRAAASGSLPAAQRRLGSSRPRGRRQVVALGPGATRFKDGDPSARWPMAAAMPNIAVAPEATTLPVPQGLSLVEAAALPETVFTVWHNVFERGGAQARRMAARPWRRRAASAPPPSSSATALGAKVMATVGSAAKVRACEALGAVRAINYREEDFVEVVREETGGHGADVILDMVGGDYIEREFARRGARRPHRADRLPRGLQGRHRFDAVDDAPADADRLDARAQGAEAKARMAQGDRGARLAADRRGQAQAGDRLRPSSSTDAAARARPHRRPRPYRQDRLVVA